MGRHWLLTRMVLVCFLLEDRHRRPQGVHGQAERERELCGAWLPRSPFLGAGQGRGKRHQAAVLRCVQAPSSVGGGAASPEMLLLASSGSLNVGFLPVAVFYLLSVPFTVTVCPQGRGGPALPTKPVIYTAKGRLCADIGDLLVRESACSPALSFWGALTWEPPFCCWPSCSGPLCVLCHSHYDRPRAAPLFRWICFLNKSIKVLGTRGRQPGA